MTPVTVPPNPVRIYALYHPESEVGRDLAEHIYAWFRMPSMEGIPVYIRSKPTRGNKVPDRPVKTPGVLEYLVPLIDAYMVQDTYWHDYLENLVIECLSPNTFTETSGWVMFPVALDGTAYNVPPNIGKRNFIRHGDDATDSSESAKASPAAAVPETLKHLTEAISRDLNARLFPDQVGRKLTIFISYARADNTAAPKALRDYIQGTTQCSVFLDENDISFGESFGSVLEEGTTLARALLVINGDNYSERAWCRWEIARFLRPANVPIHPQYPKRKQILVFHPVLVLDVTNGLRFSRVIPELGQLPSLRWAPGKELLAFSMLLREVLFGERNVLAARASRDEISAPNSLTVNRLPGPTILQRLENQRSGRRPFAAINYPGNGLPLMELRLLESSFPKTRFTAFRDLERSLPEKMQLALSNKKRPLQKRAIALSFAYSSRLAELGYLDQHMDEAVIYLLRPLVRLGCDLIYGGRPPKRNINPGEGAVASSIFHRNMTLTLMDLLNDERSGANQPQSQDAGTEATNLAPSGRLYNVAVWPEWQRITPRDRAAWVSTCSIIEISPKDIGFDAEPPRKVSDPEMHAALQALVFQCQRQRLTKGFSCPIPGDPHNLVRPVAFVFLGGKTSGFHGFMPGIMEEFLSAARERIPIYLCGGYGGAASDLASVLLQESSDRPATFTTEYYFRDTPNLRVIRSGLEQLPDFQKMSDPFDDLWNQIESGRKSGLAEFLHNGLSADENRTLLQVTDTAEGVRLIWQGLSHLYLEGEKCA